MNLPTEGMLQHLIDPQLCVRCNTCEDLCPSGAVSNNRVNYAVDPHACTQCRKCVKRCPTGAVNVWRPMFAGRFYSRDEQFEWDCLPQAEDVPAGFREAEWPSFAAAAGDMETPCHGDDTLFGDASPAMGTIVENRRLTAADAEVDIHHVVIDVSAQRLRFLEGQSVGVLPPGTDDRGVPHRPRLYSIASPRDGEDGHPERLALTVRRVIDTSTGMPRPGVCSNYLCDARAGDLVRLVGPFGESLLMPPQDDAPLVMVCTGTGIAPMRAMIRRRLASGSSRRAPQLLFYGARTPDETAYLSELSALGGPDLDIAFAFSRMPGAERRRVGHAIRERAERLAPLLRDDRTHYYLCGLHGMEEEAYQAFADVCRDQGLDWNGLHGELAASSRLHIETY